MTDARERLAEAIAGSEAGAVFGIAVAALKADRVLSALNLTPSAASALMDGTATVVPNVGCGTPDMAHAMSRLDGYDHDRDMPGLQRWLDYHDASVLASPYRSPPNDH